MQGRKTEHQAGKLNGEFAEKTVSGTKIFGTKTSGRKSYLDLIYIADGMIEFDRPALVHIGLLGSATICGRWASAGCWRKSVTRNGCMIRGGPIWRGRNRALLCWAGGFIRHALA